jgi:hypothetical protein
MEFKENPYDSNGIVLIPADSDKNIPTTAQVEKFMASEQGGQWKASGGWHATGDSNEVYIRVEKR